MFALFLTTMSRKGLHRELGGAWHFCGTLVHIEFITTLMLILATNGADISIHCLNFVHKSGVKYLLTCFMFYVPTRQYREGKQEVKKSFGNFRKLYLKKEENFLLE